MRLIDADALGIGRCDPNVFPVANRGYCAGWNGVINLIEEAPTINPESLRPKGEWKVYLGGKELMCTACQATFWDEDGNGGSDFCPNCGADMRGDINADL